jgi:hypothetical protein
MIRPFTCVCFLLACGSGLYLYQSKHRVQVLDREIEKTVHATDALREQTRVLHAEWTLLNDPQRLQALAEQFLSRKTVTPGQFTSMAELDNRLPAVRAPDPVQPEPQPVPVAQAPEATETEELPQPPIVAAVPPPSPPKRISVAAAALPPPPQRAPEHKPPPARPVLAEVSPPRPALVASRPAISAQPASPRIVPVSMPGQYPASPQMGSALGMARSAAAPPPQPMPVGSSAWSGGGGGG